MSETLATIRGSVESFQQLINQASLDGEQAHSDLYLNILEDEVRVLQMADGEVVLTYCTFEEQYFDDISLETEVETLEGTNKQGEDFEYDVGAELILDVDETETYLGFAAGDGTVELEITGDESNRLGSYLRAEGALEAWVRLPGSSSDLDGVPQWLPNRYTEDEVYCNSEGNEAPTNVVTSVDSVETIIDAVESDTTASNKPIVVEEEAFLIDVGDEDGSGVRGELSAQSVSGPDVDNRYDPGFEEVFNVLSGSVELQTAPGAPVSVVQESDGRVVRHAIGSVES